MAQAPELKLVPTPGQTVGPFYGYALPFEKDNELLAPGSPGLNIVSRCETADGCTALINCAIHPGGVITHTISRPAP